MLTIILSKLHEAYKMLYKLMLQKRKNLKLKNYTLQYMHQHVHICQLPALNV